MSLTLGCVIQLMACYGIFNWYLCFALVALMMDREACCDSWGHKELDTTERLSEPNRTDTMYVTSSQVVLVVKKPQPMQET